MPDSLRPDHGVRRRVVAQQLPAVPVVAPVGPLLIVIDGRVVSTVKLRVAELVFVARAIAIIAAPFVDAADRVVVLRDGQVAADGTRDGVRDMVPPALRRYVD